MKNKLLLVLAFILMPLTLMSCGQQTSSTSDEKIIFPAEGIASTEYNTGRVLFSIMKDSGNTMITNFLFTSGSRNFWHYHPSEQSLLVLDGEGYYQEEGKPKQYIKPGDVIFGDIDGVVVIPRAIAYEVLLRAEEINRNEREMKNWVHEGFSAVEMVNNGGYF